MKQKRKLVVLTIVMLCLWPSITTKNTDQNKEKQATLQKEQQSTLKWEDQLAQNLTVIGAAAIKDIKTITKGADKASSEWLKQVDKTTKTADDIVDAVRTFMYESQEWLKEIAKVREEAAMLRKDLNKQVIKLIITASRKGAGSLLLITGIIGLYVSLRYPVEKYNNTLSGGLCALVAVGGIVFLY